jgi:hypothetical protein
MRWGGGGGGRAGEGRGLGGWGGRGWGGEGGVGVVPSTDNLNPWAQNKIKGKARQIQDRERQ